MEGTRRSSIRVHLSNMSITVIIKKRKGIRVPKNGNAVFAEHARGSRDVNAAVKRQLIYPA